MLLWLKITDPSLSNDESHPTQDSIVREEAKFSLVLFASNLRLEDMHLTCIDQHSIKNPLYEF